MAQGYAKLPKVRVEGLENLELSLEFESQGCIVAHLKVRTNFECDRILSKAQ